LRNAVVATAIRPVAAAAVHLILFQPNHAAVIAMHCTAHTDATAPGQPAIVYALPVSQAPAAAPQ
jgi:hypothetical protein